MPLQNLANEILIHIIKETLADDIVSLASCCNQFSILAQGRLAYHRQKRAEAEDVVVGCPVWKGTTIHPSKYLREILKNEHSRFYTRVMEIGSLGFDDPDDVQPGDPLITNLQSQFGNQIATLMAKVYTALLPHAEKTSLEEWTNEVKHGERAAVVILLALYPNLKILRIHDLGQEWWKEESIDDHWGNIFRSLTTTAMNSATNTFRIFSKLSIFHLLGDGDDGGLESNAELLPPFMALLSRFSVAGRRLGTLFRQLPTMRGVIGHVVDGHSVHWTYGTGPSEVKVLDLEDDIDRRSLFNLISGLKSIEEFRYNFSVPAEWVERVHGGDDLDGLKWGPRVNDDAAMKGLADEDDSEEDDSGEEASGKEDPDPPKMGASRYYCNSFAART